MPRPTVLIPLAAGLFSLLLPFSLSADIRFADVTASAGLTHTIHGEGVCVLDIDNDGLEDIFIAGANGRNLLYRNLGGMIFEEVAAWAGVDSTGWARLVLSSDYDGDGDADLFIGCHNTPSYLFRNNGDGTFEDVTAASGISNAANTRGGAWFDHDRDGHPDLYVANFQQANILCRNNGDGTFTEIAAAVNARGPLSSGLIIGMGVIDFDRDGDGDLFMAQDGDRGNILLRRDEDGRYTDVSLDAGVVLPVMGMGVGVGDYNGDLLPDVYVTNLDESSLLRNNGDGTFTDVAAEAGVGDQPAHMGWGTFFFDADNDGWADIYNNNQSGFGGVPNSFYRNNGDGTFEDLSGAAGLMSYNDGLGSAFADFDNDGRLDIVLSGGPSASGNLILFRNISTNDNNWLQLTLHPSIWSESATGTAAEVFVDGIPQVQWVNTGNGYVSQNSSRLHFGLGLSPDADSAVVYWVDGTVDVFRFLAGNTHHELVQGTGTTSVSDSGTQPERFLLLQNFPNPFNPETTIRYQIPERGEVTLTVTDLLGQELSVLVDGIQESGEYAVRWNAHGRASGIYLYRLELRAASGALISLTGRMVLIR